jgi:hypothetical protein
MGSFGGFDGSGDPPTNFPFGPGSGFDYLLGLIFTVYGLLLRSIGFVWFWVRYLVSALILLFQRLSKFLLHIWQQYVKRAIQWLALHVQKLRAWLKRTIGPIIKRLEKIKKWYDTHILKQQLRTLQMLQTIRRFLGILRIFHVKWAAKLDATLADMQNRIEQSIAIVRGTLNQIITTLGLVLDPALLITRDVLAGSLLKNLAAVKRVMGYSQHGPLTASETTFLEHNVDRYNRSAADKHIAAVASSGLTAYDQSERTASRKGISDAIGAPLPF